MRKFRFLFFMILAIACNNPDETSGGQISNEDDMLEYGKKVYESQCVNCHAMNGKAKVAECPDLSKSGLSETEIGDLIYHGKGQMPAYKEKLGEPEINALAKFVKNFRTD